MKILLALALIVAALLWYALWGRDWLKRQSWAAGFFAMVEPIEVALFKKSETILVARLLSVLGGVMTVLAQLGSIDITPLMPLVPDRWEPYVHIVWNLLPLTITGLGMIVEKLRNSTTLPLEVVAIPERTIVENQRVAEVVAKVEEVKAEAVAVVKAETA